jgi:GntR family transcriptional repressor for pyruvate dehydrogenase complex
MQWRVITEKYEIRNLMELRLALEGLAAASSAERATEQELTQIEDLVQRMRAAMDDAKQFSALTWSSTSHLPTRPRIRRSQTWSP